jgi:hypothetical protein
VSLLDRLEDVRIVVVDRGRRILFAWFGGHGVHIFDQHGREVDLFTVGDFAKDEAEPRDVLHGINRYLSEEE